MAIDPNKKFLYFNKDNTSGEMDDALCFPISSFIGAETQTASIIDFHFKGSKGTDATVVRAVIDTGFINIKTFYKKFVDQINFGEIAFIKVADHAEKNTHHSDVTFAMTGDIVPTFTLQDTDFKIADSISIGGHSVNDIDITNEFVDSDEHLMTSKAINARIAAAGGGVSVSDSTANTDFPVVFHDESNNLHDDTGAFTYNPSSGNLTIPGNLNVNGTDHLIQSDQSLKPVFELKNTSSGNGGPELKFNKQIGTNPGVDDTDLGAIRFVGDDSAGNEHTYFTIEPEIQESTDGDEAGRVTLYVATSDGSTSTLQSALYAQGSASDNDVDVSLGKGITSMTTINGDLTVSGGDIYGTTDNDLRLRSDDDIALFLDGDNDGTSSVKIVNGASSNVVIISETGSIYTADTIELGHATDTTLARSAAGKVTIEGNQIVTAGAVSVASGSQTAVGVQIARRTITQGEANAMDSTPIELIPAQGANTVIVILGGMIRVDRAATQTSALVTLHFHYEGEEPGTYGQSLLYHHRRFMYNETTDRVFHVCPALGIGGVEVADSLTEDVNAAVEASFSSAITNNSVNSIDVYLNYQVIDIS